jgi:rhodanese-related sulfurtransferase
MIAITALAAALSLSAPTLPPPGVVDGSTGQKLAAQGALVVDVRTPAEYLAGHIPGALLIPHDQIAARAAELGAKDRPILLYCRTGRRTGVARAELTRLGYTAVYDMQGLSGWPGQVVTGPPVR